MYTMLAIFNVARVNRFHGLPLTDPNPKLAIEEKLDLIEALLDHNLIDIVEEIFEYIGFQSTWYFITSLILPMYMYLNSTVVWLI
jgi:hypothetical protein